MSKLGDMSRMQTCPWDIAYDPKNYGPFGHVEIAFGLFSLYWQKCTKKNKFQLFHWPCMIVHLVWRHAYENLSTTDFRSINISWINKYLSHVSVCISDATTKRLIDILECTMSWSETLMDAKEQSSAFAQSIKRINTVHRSSI